MRLSGKEHPRVHGEPYCVRIRGEDSDVSDGEGALPVGMMDVDVSMKR